jgi:hypothetical protein
MKNYDPLSFAIGEKQEPKSRQIPEETIGPRLVDMSRYEAIAYSRPHIAHSERSVHYGVEVQP